jgi:hypothetical protein
MHSKQDHLDGTGVLLLERWRLTTHRHRCCPFCHGTVYRERRKGLQKLTTLLAMRIYRCESCDKLHYGFSF